MSSADSSLPLATGSFQLQGAVNWDNLAQKTVSFSVGVLSRLAASGVDPYSVVVGQAIAQRFPLSRIGRQNVQAALAALPSHGGYGNLLWFGFGIQSFARTLGATDQGCSLLALCAALAECYHDDFAADVMHNIVLQHNPPDQLTPSLNQWLMIIRACEGVLSATKFPLLAEGLMRLDLRPPRSKAAWLAISFRECPLPEKLAAAIIGIGKVASGSLQAIRITGCSAVGWIAAVGEWLYGLRVVIYNQQGELVYSNFPLSEDPQVHISFGSSNPLSNEVEVASRTYVLDDCAHFIFREMGAMSCAIVSGRVSWDSCLKSTFGSNFDKLMRTPMNVGMVLGSAARIFKAIALGVPVLDKMTRAQWCSYSSRSHGHGFIRTVLQWFPELLPAQPGMEKAVRMKIENAESKYEENLTAIQALRNCVMCRDWGKTDMGSFCLVIMLETVLVVAQTLASLSVADGLCPMRSGLEEFYDRQLGKSIERQSRRPRSITFILDFFRRGVGHNYYYRLQDALMLFTGHLYPAEWPGASQGTTAMSEGGVCVYLDILREFTLNPELTGLVHVVPGRIEKDNKPFRMVQDSLASQHAPRPTANALLAKLSQISLRLTETPKSLRVTYVLGTGDLGTGCATVPISPGCLVLSALKARGLVNCSRSASRCGDLSKRNILVDCSQYPIIQARVDGKPVMLCDGRVGGDNVRAAAIRTRKPSLPEHSRTILADEECLDCCFAEALELIGSDEVGFDSSSILIISNSVSQLYKTTESYQATDQGGKEQESCSRGAVD